MIVISIKVTIILIISGHCFQCLQNSTYNDNNGQHLVTVNANATVNKNNTDDDDDSSNNKNLFCSKPLTAEAPLWCPYNYRLLYQHGWKRLCRPTACIDLTYVNNFTTNNLPQDTCIESLNSMDKTAKICANNRFREHTERFLRCSKESLQPFQYEILNNGSLWNSRDQTLVSLSEYFLTEKGVVMICTSNDNGVKNSTDPNSILSWCIPIPDTNRSPQMTLIDNLLSTGHSVLDSNNATATVCIKTSVIMQKCEFFKNYDAAVMEMDDNLDIVNSVTLLPYRFGDYFVDLNQSNFYVCRRVVFNSLTRRYLYGSVFAVSAFCLIMVLVVHLLYQKLNSYTKDLLCLVFSYCVMYSLMAYKYIYPNFDYGITSVILFCVLYVSTMSALFWLNVLAFDLWRVFSRLQRLIRSETELSNKVGTNMFDGDQVLTYDPL